MVLEKTVESPLDCKEIQPVHPKDQSWVFIGRTGAKAETPILRPPHVKSWLIGKDSDAGGDWEKEKGTTEYEMAGWHHQLDEHEFEWTPGVGDGQGGLVCCDSWGHKESDTTEWLNWTEQLDKSWSTSLWLQHIQTSTTHILLVWDFLECIHIMNDRNFGSHQRHETSGHTFWCPKRVNSSNFLKTIPMYLNG